MSYGTERAAAEAAVAGVTGVRNVINDIEIRYVIDPIDVDLHVQEALDRSAMVPDGSDVKTDTKDGVITLTGHVRTWAEHDAVVGDRVDGPRGGRRPRRTRGHRLTVASGAPVLMSDRWRQGHSLPHPRRAGARHPASVRIRLVSTAPRQARRHAS